MKTYRMRTLGLIAALALLLAAVPFSAVPVSAAGADRTIGKMATAPTVDGVIDDGEWGNKYMELHNYQTSTIAKGAEKVALSGKVYFGYDSTHFYLAVEAQYDYHENYYTGFDLWQGDALQIQLSADGKNRRAFCFGLGSDGQVRGYQSGTETYEPTAPGGEFYVKRNEDTKTTVYEVALPLSRFSDSVTTLKQGDEIKFSYAVHMHNGYYYEWCGGIVDNKNINLAATLTLGSEADLNVAGERLPMGDVDGDGKVTSTDARLVLQRAVEKIDDADLDTRVADVDGDGIITSTDARMILDVYAKKLAPEDLPAGDALILPGEGASSRYVSSNSFSPMSEQAGRSFNNIYEINYWFEYFALTTEANEGLPFNVVCCLDYDRITAMVPAGVDLSHIIPTFKFDGYSSVEADGQPLVSDATVLDLTRDVALTLISEGGERRTVMLHVETLDTGLPSVAMTVENYWPIDSKDDYRAITFYVGGGDADETLLVTGRAKGRGNTSWNEPKKGYTVKLDKKAQLLNMSESKDWALIANYEDETLLRNIIAQYLAEGAGVEYVMKNRPVDLWYNGEYWGTYNLVEKIEIEKDRVNITKYDGKTDPGNTGFLMEFDGHVNEVDQWERDSWERPLQRFGSEYNEMYYSPVKDELFMKIDIGGKWLTIKKPSYDKLLEENDFEQLAYIYDRVHEVIQAVKSRNYSEITKYIDVESWCRWYLVEEYMNNTDSSFHSSCYMTLDVNGKFKLGPVWDFDRSSNNCDYWNVNENIDDLYNAGSAWFRYIFSCEEAREILKDEYKKFRPTLDTLPEYLEQMADSLYAAQIYNFQKWDILDHAALNVDTSNLVGQAMMASQTYEAEVARLEAYFYRTTEKMDAFMKNLPAPR